MIDIAGFQSGWVWIARVLPWPFRARHRCRRLAGVECLSDHMRRDIGLG